MIPTTTELEQSILQFLYNRPDRPYCAQEMLFPLANQFRLTLEELKAEYTLQTPRHRYIFLERIQKTLGHLLSTRMIERPRRGYYSISAGGRLLLEAPTLGFPVALQLESFNDFMENLQRQAEEPVPLPPARLRRPKRILEELKEWAKK